MVLSPPKAQMSMITEHTYLITYHAETKRLWICTHKSHRKTVEGEVPAPIIRPSRVHKRETPEEQRRA
jgi:hypothetical protein